MFGRHENAREPRREMLMRFYVALHETRETHNGAVEERDESCRNCAAVRACLERSDAVGNPEMRGDGCPLGVVPTRQSWNRVEMLSEVFDLYSHIGFLLLNAQVNPPGGPTLARRLLIRRRVQPVVRLRPH